MQYADYKLLVKRRRKMGAYTGETISLNGLLLEKPTGIQSYVPPNISFKNEGNVFLNALTLLGANSEFENNGDVFLSLLNSLPPDTIFKNQGNVFLNTLNTLGANSEFENRGDVFLNSLITLPKDAKFKNNGFIWVKSKRIKGILLPNTGKLK